MLYNKVFPKLIENSIKKTVIINMNDQLKKQKAYKIIKQQSL